eukprot:1157486-Pelagomonas_calceolata.AAC.5
MLLQKHARPLGGRATPDAHTRSIKPALTSSGLKQRVGSSVVAAEQWRIVRPAVFPRRRAGITQATATSSPTSTILSALPGSQKIGGGGGGPVILLGA